MRTVSIILSALLAIGIAAESVLLSNGIKSSPTTAERSLPSTTSYLHDKFNDVNSSVVKTLREFDENWQTAAIQEIDAWYTGISLPEEDDENPSEFEEMREQLTAKQKVVLVIQQFYTDLGIIEGAVEGEIGYVSPLDQMRGLAVALLDSGVLGIKESQLVVTEDGKERYMTEDERAAYVLQIAKNEGYITFKLSDFWKDVEAERKQREEEERLAQQQQQQQQSQQQQQGGTTQPDTTPEYDTPAYQDQDDVPENYHGQFKATFVCTCSECFVANKYVGIKRDENAIFADPAYIDVGRSVTLDMVKALAFTVKDGTGYVTGRDIIVFYNNHAMATQNGTCYPKVYYK